jgi:hypothetical protein
MKSNLPGHSGLDFTKFDCYDLKWKEKSGPVVPDTLISINFAKTRLARYVNQILPCLQR